MSVRRIPSAQRDNISQLLAPDNGYRGSLQKKGIQPKNHMKENLRELRIEQERNRTQREQEQVEEKPLYKLPQFQDVESRLYETSQRYAYRRNSLDRNPNINDENESPEFLTRGTSDRRRHELDRKNKEIREELERKIQEEMKSKEEYERKLVKKNSSSNLKISSNLNTRKDPVPPKQERGVIQHHHSDYIHENKHSVKKNATSSATASALGSIYNDNNSPGFHEEFGRVPQYIRERNLEWQREKERKEKEREDANCPQGMRLMDEEERLETLNILEQKKQELIAAINKLPFHCETLSQKKRHQELEDKMREIDTALSLFRKPKVYVAK